MGIQLDKTAYQKLIDENIEALNKYMPEHSLEKKHTIEVLKWSVSQIYGAVEKNVDTSERQLTIPDVSNCYMADCLIQDSCLRFKQKGCKKDCKLYM